MPGKHIMSVSLTGHLCGFVGAQVASGRFRSASEVVRAGLRLLERDLAEPAPARGDGPGASAGDGADGPAPPRSAP
jgi:antitoxin ParD1/3/4